VKMQLTYTQWEAYLAIQLGVKLVIIQKAPGAATVKHEPDPNQLALQEAHLKRLRDAHEHLHTKQFTSKEDLGTLLQHCIAEAQTHDNPLKYGEPISYVQVSPARRAGTHRPVVAISVQRARDDLEVRSVTYYLQGDPSQVEKADAVNRFMIHLEPHRGDHVFPIEIHLADGSAVKARIPISFTVAPELRMTRYKIARNGKWTVEESPARAGG